ncbi:putative aldouronate transport system substrate-binding protein [Cohnella sp. OV330]|uniref:extracellular solute-binding protein n=1 Tax=Cohnella sp. OV330 TaxID=1855288 RepID=UPI0008E6F617|nr:extracellular solute-binding protein [Cohnella sp. OV330]SFB56420.1 putative aldouronate transport system substrate-binding protein [Cohnella sp. OV330]
MSSIRKPKIGKRAIPAAAALAVITALLSACSGSGVDGSDAGSSLAATGGSSPSFGSSSDSSASSSDPSTLRLLTDATSAAPVKEDWAVWKWIKEKTNITIKQELQTGPESLALAIASGDMPDLMSVFPTDVPKYGPQGAFLDLSKYMDRMPHLKAFLASRPDIAARIAAPGGEIYNVLNDGLGPGIQTVYFYREDIFKKHGLEAPKTWDEMYDTAKKLKALYPDSYPFAFRHGVNTLKYFAPAYGVYPFFYEDASTGKIKYGVTDPGFKKLVADLNRFYEEGLTPPDWLSIDYKAWTQFMATGKSFMTIQFIGQIEIMNAQLKGGAHLKFMAPPVGYGDRAYIPNAAYEEYGFAVSSRTKHLDAALRYLDFIYSDEGKDLLSWGKEGETYEIVDGKRKFLPRFEEPNDLRKELGVFTTGAYGRADFEATKSLMSDNERYAYAEAEKYQYPVTNALPPLTPEERSAIVLTEEAVNKYYETSVVKFVMGETPMSEWDGFLEGLFNLGAQKLIDAYQVGLDRLKNGHR